ncbi:putative MAE-28990/MAE-18760-like HEPN domain-containing protein [Vibrio crassostreae]|nr:putative MAE-28990/MAE-18760-like HEPN domain-containing protein [Vibrio crassostreae]
MDSLAKENFENRLDDIDLIRALSEVIDNKLLAEKSTEAEITVTINEDTLNVLKSCIQMLTYNLVESSMRSCLEGVYDHIEDNGVGYNQLVANVQEEILSGFLKKFDTGALFRSEVKNDLNLLGPKASLAPKKVFNGNIDADKVHSIKKKYRLNLNPHRELRNGTDLDWLKDSRNELSHGNSSFSEHGRKDDLKRVLEQTDRVVGYVNTVITSFEDYMDTQSYLRQ